MEGTVVIALRAKLDALTYHPDRLVREAWRIVREAIAKATP
ncbi:MAG: hypothetical protein Q8P38_05555 [Candidatus Nanopelagicales bacterium]|nr:hypothetical protein [Candidatus Nanopelagicales bacterium]